MATRLEAGLLGAKSIDTEHLLIGIARAETALLEQLSVPLSAAGVREAAARWQQPEDRIPKSVDMPLTEDVQKVLHETEVVADAGGCQSVRTEHMLQSLLIVPDTHASMLLQEAGLSAEKLAAYMSTLNCNEPQERDVIEKDELFSAS